MLFELLLTRPVASTLAFLALLVIFLKPHLRGHSRSPPYPPGPRFPSMPTRNLWVKYREWAQQYGDVVFVQEHQLLILNSLEASLDLLDKRARISSDRPFNAMMKLSNAYVNWAMVPYSDEWRRKRKIFHQHFRADAAKQFRPAQYAKVNQFLRVLTVDPEQFQLHTMSLSQGIIFSALYGLDLGAEDRLAQIAVSAMHKMGLAVTPGEYPLIEMFPWLRHLPTWLPGLKFQQMAKHCRADLHEMNNGPFNIAIERQKSGSGSSFIAELASKHEGNNEEIELVKSVGLISYIAAADTTMGIISSFLLAMTLHPEIQAKAQEEIDRVIGQDRLPTLDDRESLPYIEAIYLEAFRLHPPLPLGVPHQTMEDDIYRGFYIPKGCTVIPNIWAMNRDENLYERPEEFNPERYLDSVEGPFNRVTEITAFGFGRRVCAGRHMADATVWIAIASILATMTLGKAKDFEGTEIEIVEEYTDDFFRHPKPYRCSIEPRSEQARKLILSASSA